MGMEIFHPRSAANRFVLSVESEKPFDRRSLRSTAQRPDPGLNMQAGTGERRVSTRASRCKRPTFQRLPTKKTAGLSRLH